MSDKKLILEENGEREEFLGFSTTYVAVLPRADGHRACWSKPQNHYIEAGGTYTDRLKSTVVWQNECQLVFGGGAHEVEFEMGLDYPEDKRSVRVKIVEIEGDDGFKLMDEIRACPVRITIERVPGGNR